MEQVINAESNPQLANQLVNQAIATAAQAEASGGAQELKPAPLPPDTKVELLGGLFDPFTNTNETEAEIRELTGTDEEAIAKITDLGKSLLAILQRGVVSIGGTKATAEMLDDLLAGDRELLLLAIRKATFGSTVEVSGPCPHCNAEQDFEIDLNADVTLKKLDDPVSDRQFIVTGKAGTFKVALPTGHAQKKLMLNAEKTTAELDTMLLRECVLAINEKPVIDVRQVLSLGIQDRRKLTTEIGERNPGPQLSEITKSCSSCGQEVPLPLTVADTFRL